MQRRPLLLALTLLAAVAASAQDTPRRIMLPAKRAITHETLWMMKRVSSPALSPDGKWVVFQMVEPSYDDKEQRSDLWIVPSTGGAEPRRLTYSKSGESDVAWSNDSSRIAFSAKREGDEASQIYVLDVAGGGEAQRVTSSSTGARSPQFRPDGNAILFITTAYPGAADDEANKQAAKELKDRKYKVRAFESFPIRNWDRWLDDTQPHIAVQELNNPRAKTAVDILAGSKLIAAAGFAGRGGEGSTETLDAAWSPDGSSIVFAATSNRNVAAYAEYGTDLYRADPHGGSEPHLIAHAEGSYSRPKFSPDGKALFTVFNPNNGKVYNLDRLVRYDWPSMENRKVVTANTDRSVGSFAITPNGDTVYFTAEDAGLEKIYSVPAAGGEVKLVVDPPTGVYTNLQVAQSSPSLVMTALWGSSIDPKEVVRVDLASKSHANLTEIDHMTARNIDWDAPQHFWFTSTRGRKIHNMIVTPAAFDPSKKYPLFVLIHGGPAGMWRDEITLRWNYHLLARPGYIVLLTDYVGSTGYGEKFGQDIQGDPLKGPGEEINQAADEAVKRFPFIDGSRMAAGGASYGGHLANWLEATTTRYKCLISHAGLINLESQWGTSDTIYSRELMNLGPVWEQGKVWREQNPIRYAKNFKTPMLLSVGEHDFRVPMNETLENWAALQRMRVPSRLLVWPDENHWILNPENSRQFYKEVADWLARWVK
jgi:dipeptidyl aminopeptidase/acylaminoacyl peptidase